MENFLNKIDSKYIIHKIFDYIQDKNFHLKLSKYSNLIKQKLGIHLIDYQTVYVENFLFYFDKIIKGRINLDIRNYDKDISQKYEDYL